MHIIETYTYRGSFTGCHLHFLPNRVDKPCTSTILPIKLPSVESPDPPRVEGLVASIHR